MDMGMAVENGSVRLTGDNFYLVPAPVQSAKQRSGQNQIAQVVGP
jgi:hypothetical protein